MNETELRTTMNETELRLPLVRIRRRHDHDPRPRRPRLRSRQHETFSDRLEERSPGFLLSFINDISRPPCHITRGHLVKKGFRAVSTHHLSNSSNGKKRGQLGHMVRELQSQLQS